MYECVCVVFNSCVGGYGRSSLEGKCSNQTSERDDKSAFRFGPQRLAVGSKNQQPSAAQVSAGQVWPPPFPARQAGEHTEPTWCLELLSAKWNTEPRSSGQATWWSHSPWELLRSSGDHCLIKVQPPWISCLNHIGFFSHLFNQGWGLTWSHKAPYPLTRPSEEWPGFSSACSLGSPRVVILLRSVDNQEAGAAVRAACSPAVQ